MPAIYEHKLIVSQQEIDRLGHVNNIEYLQWMQDAATAHSTAQGWPGSRYGELGAGWVVRSHKIEYLAPALLDDAVVVKTWVANFEKIRSLRKFKIFREADNTVLAIAETQWVFICFQRRQPRRVPDEVRNAFIIVSESEEVMQLNPPAR
jgi:acyl-CoA thioester hydrolase